MWLVAILALATLMLGVAACGGDEEGAAEEPAPAEAVEPAGGEATTVQIAADPDGALAYDQTALTAPAGTVTVEFTNEAALGHDFRIEEVEAGTSVFAAGSESVTVELEPGEYTFFCSVPGHRSGGMEGKLIVE
jgi:plastocyanin